MKFNITKKFMAIVIAVGIGLGLMPLANPGIETDSREIIESFNAFDEFSTTNPDGDVWKYKIRRGNDITFPHAYRSDAWRAGADNWEGVGNSPAANSQGLSKALELNSMGNTLGILEFNAPFDGVYNIPSFKFTRIDGWAEPGMRLFILQNGEEVYSSDRLNATSLYIDEQNFELERGDSLEFYTNYSPAGEFSNAFVENLVINFVAGDITGGDTPGVDERIDLSNPHASGADYVIEDELSVTFQINGLTLGFNKQTGDMVAIDNGSQRINMLGGFVDVGLGNVNSYARSSMSFFDFDNLATYEIPNVNYNILGITDPENAEFEEMEDSVIVTTMFNNLKISTHYKVVDEMVEIYATIENDGTERMWINGMSFILRDLVVNENATFNFPGNLPYDVFEFSELPHGSTYSTQYTGPLTQVMSGNTTFNLYFVNPDEKWSSAVVKGVFASPQRLHAVSITALQSYLERGESLECGSFYIQFANENQNANELVQEFYTSKGWIAPTDGVRDGGIYSGHPAGTSDNFFTTGRGEFTDRYDRTLTTYAQELDAIKNLGFDNLWILPIFEHPHHSGSVYMPYNMEKIDSRYGGDEAARIFGKAAKDLGLNLMIDYVPHGPPPRIGGGVTNPWVDEVTSQWISLDRDGNRREEWGCYAYDYAHPDYLEYFKNLVTLQAQEFGFVGSRIDCGMGSLPNWNAPEGNRPSNTNTLGGMLMSKAIRDGFLEAGVKPAVMPENFHPIPTYAPYTDFFYDIAFYNMTLQLRNANASETEFANTISDWLDRQYQTRPEGLVFARFLGNHDTVADWYSTYDNARPKEIYGVNKTHALWVMLSTIDGVPVIYQGDEVGSEDFFSELMEMRKEYLGTDLEIEYFHDDESAIVAYRRYDDENQRLVLVNLANKEDTRSFENIKLGDLNYGEAFTKVIYGDAQVSNAEITIPAYGYVVLELSDEEIEDVTEPIENETPVDEDESQLITIILVVVSILIIVIGVSVYFLKKKAGGKKNV